MQETLFKNFFITLKELSKTPGEFDQAKILLREAFAGRTFLIDLAYAKLKIQCAFSSKYENNNLEVLYELCHGFKGLNSFRRALDKATYGALTKILTYLTEPRMGGPLLQALSVKKIQESMSLTQLFSYIIQIIYIYMSEAFKNIALNCEETPRRYLGNYFFFPQGEFNIITVRTYNIANDLFSDLLEGVKHATISFGDFTLEYAEREGKIQLVVNREPILKPTKELDMYGVWKYSDLEPLKEVILDYCDRKYDSLNHNCQHLIAIILNYFGESGLATLKLLKFPAFPLLQSAKLYTTPQLDFEWKDDLLTQKCPNMIDLEFQEAIASLKVTAAIQNAKRTKEAFFGECGKFEADISYIKDFPNFKYTSESPYSEWISNTAEFLNPQHPRKFSEKEIDLLDKRFPKLFTEEEVEILFRTIPIAHKKFEVEEVDLSELDLFSSNLSSKRRRTLKHQLKSFTEGALELAFSTLNTSFKTLGLDFYTLERLVNKLEKYCQFMSLRKGKKTVWAPFFDTFRMKVTKFQEDHSTAFQTTTEVKLFEDPYENIKTQTKELSDYFQIKEYEEYGAYRRYIRHQPLVDFDLKMVEANLRAKFDFPIGVGSNQFSDAYHIWASTQRYFKENKKNVLSVESVDAVAEALLEAFPGSFADAKLVSYFKVMKTVNRKFSSSFPFFCDKETKTKAQLFRKLSKQKINDYLMMQVKRGFVYEHIHHVFPKISVLKLEKILKEPESFRTIIAQYWPGYAHMMTFSYDVNKRDHYMFLPAQIRLPMAGGYLSMLAKRHAQYKHTFATDMSKWDSSLPDDIIDIVRRLRQLGFKNHYNYKQIASFIEANYEALKKGALFDTIGGKVWRMLCGETTGHANTTMDNSISLIAAFLIAWHDLTGRPYLEFFKYNLLSCYGDDNIFSTNLVTNRWNPKSLCEYLSEKLGITMRVEAEGKITDVSFLAKTFIKGEVYLDEFCKAGIKVPEYAVVHDRQRLLTNFTTLKMKRNTSIWLYQRAMGYLLNTAHHKEVYDEIANYMRFLINKPNTGILCHNGGHKFIKKFPIMSYEQVLRVNYMTKNERLENVSKPYNWNIVDSLKLSYNMVGTLEYFIDTSIDTVKGVAAFCYDNGLSNCEIELFGFNKPNQYLEDFAVESFVYLKNGLPQSYETFNRLMMESPWFVISRPEKFWNEKMPELKESDLNYFEERMYFLTALYICVHRGLNKFCSFPLLGIAAKLFKLKNFEAPHIYANLNYSYWLTHGHSSLALSSLMPKDAWKNHKEAAVFIMNRIPFNIPLPLEMLKTKPKILIDLITKLFTVKWKVENMLLNAMTNITNWNQDLPFENQWIEHRDKILDLLAENKKLQIKSGTSTGKTSCLPRILANHYDTIWLLSPRRCLVDQVNLPSLDKVHGKNQQPLTGAKFVSTTYGWFEAHRPLISERDLLFFDEFHEKDIAMFKILNDYEHTHQIFSSATPIDNIKVAVYDTKMVRRNPLQIETFSNKKTDIKLKFLEAIEKHPGESGLFILPNMRFNNKFLQSLRVAFPNEEFSLFDSDHPVPATSGHILATSIVDSGMDIKHLKFVVDSGVSLILKNGKMQMRLASENTLEQRAGRVGRHSKGYVYRCIDYSCLPYVEADISPIEYCNHYALLKDWFPLQKVEYKIKSYDKDLPNCTDLSCFSDEVVDSYKTMLQLYYQNNGQKLQIKKNYNKLRRGEDYELLKGNTKLWRYEEISDFMNENPMLSLVNGKEEFFHVAVVFENRLVLKEIEW